MRRVRLLPLATPGSLSTRLLVAAGGGGGGEYGFLSPFSPAGGAGGGGGGGADGTPQGSSVLPGHGGSVGTAAAGGPGGSGGNGPGGAGTAGGAGSLGLGGSGGETSQGAVVGGGGGGGGGLYGGGGGGAGGCCQGAGGGGGAGSNLGPAGGTATLSSEPPSVAITYAAATADVDAASLAFAGVQPLGSVSAPRAVTIANHGSAPLAVSGLSFAGADAGDFLLGSSTCGGLIAAGSSCQVAVRFAPTAGGARAGRLVIASNAPDAGVDLSGTGGALPAGVRGETGPPGPAGAPGAPGAPGSVELVTCTTKKVKKHTRTTCRGGLVSGPLKFVFGNRATVARATLLRGRKVVARGTAVRRGKRMRLLLKPSGALRPGRYTVRLAHRRLSVVLR